jgi:hypothetical protein
MSIEDARGRLAALAPRARDETARLDARRGRQGGPPMPGDLFVLVATKDLPVEWAILERRSTGAGGELLAVPADTNPAAGSADVEVPAGARGGPLSLRCRFGAWLDAGLFAAAKRSGSLAPETVAEALRHFRHVEAGTLEPSPLAEEVDADPEYADWIRDVPERAASLALAASQRRSQSHPHRWEDYPLAAIFALLAIGLLLWGLQMRRERDQLLQPIFDIPSQELDLGEQTRGSRSSLEVPPGADRVLLHLVLDNEVAEQPGHFEIASAAGRIVWRSQSLRLIQKGFPLVVQRVLLPDGEYRVRAVSDADGSTLADSTLEIETAQRPAER